MEFKSDNHFVSVIIPTVGRDTLSIVLKALENQTRKPDEIIISKDENREGISITRNKGIEKSKGDLIAFLDDDNVPDKDWLVKFIAVIDTQNADGVSSGYVESDNFLQEIRIRRNLPKENVWNLGGVFGIGGNVIYKRKCLEDLIKKDEFVFNTNFYVSDDIELGWRLIKNGCKLLYVTDNNIKHLKTLTAKQFLRHQFNRGKSIYELYEVKNIYKDIETGNSLLWSEKNKFKRYFSILVKQVLGPFDHESFSTKKNFLLFWLGEKFKAAGFLYFMFEKKFRKKSKNKNEIKFENVIAGA